MMVAIECWLVQTNTVREAHGRQHDAKRKKDCCAG